LYPKEYTKAIFMYVHLHFLHVLVYNKSLSGTRSFTEI